ncbi:hypothetical protein [Streptomyces sp. NPDC050121]|jgi:hypothetical protein|uniref:hypothetical protein n=1 Tax=Streptomyces sp. NPDC050121 TaxID=3365601 RepID=UPI0037A07490
MNSGRTRSTGVTESTGATRAGEGREAARQGAGWTRAARGPWTVLCAVAAVVLGPAAATASALEQANSAPMHHAVRADRPQAYIPTDSTRRKLAV